MGSRQTPASAARPEPVATPTSTLPGALTDPERGPGITRSILRQMSVTLSRGRSIEAVRFVELQVEERGPVLRLCVRQVRGGVRFFGSADADAVVAAADAYPVFRLASSSAPPGHVGSGDIPAC